MLGLSVEKDSGVKIKKDVDLLAARLERLFFIPPDALIGSLGKGSRVLDYFWEGDTIENAQGVLHEVKWLLRNYEPSIIPINITVKIIAEGSNAGLIISLNFYWVDNTNEAFDITIIKAK